MYNYNTLKNEFLQYKNFLGIKYKSGKVIINEIVTFLNDNKVNEITKDVTIKYTSLNKNIKSNTISRNMSVFREFCKFLKYQKGIDCYQIPNKFYIQKFHNFTPHIFSHEEIKTIYSNLNCLEKNYHNTFCQKQAYKLIIKILYQTGMRVGEVLNLNKLDYNNELSIFHLKDTKNNEERIVAIPSNLNKEINTFINKFNIKDKIFNISICAINIYFKKVLRLSNIIITDNGPRVHDLRFTFIVHSIEQAINNKENLDVFLPILQAQVGHKSINSLSYYFHITNDILNITNKISEKHLGYLIRKCDDYE